MVGYFRLDLTDAISNSLKTFNDTRPLYSIFRVGAGILRIFVYTTSPTVFIIGIYLDKMNI